MARTEIHFSELAAASGCKRRWQLQYQQRLRAVGLEERLTVGTLVHHAMHQLFLAQHRTKNGKATAYADAYIIQEATQSKLNQLRAAGLQASSDFEDDGAAQDEPNPEVVQAEQDDAAMLQRSFEVTLRLWEFVNQHYELVELPDANGVMQPAVEYELRVPVKRRGHKTIEYVGTLDILLRRKSDGAVLLGDFKVRSKLTTLMADMLHSQTALYQYALLTKGVKTDGSVVIQALNSPINEPKVTKDGKGVYKTKIITTVEKYQDVMTSVGLSPNDPAYADVLAEIAARSWVEDHVIPRKADSAEVINSATKVLLDGLRDITALEKLPGDRGTLIGYQCRTCAYYPLCEAELAGYDANWIRENQFYVKED